VEVRTTLSTPYPFELLNHGRQHVFRDLHPYCCTFEDCATADRLYDSRYAWFKHELEAHRAIWQCVDGCEKTFAAEKDFVAHVAKKHPEMASDDVLSVLKRTAVKSANLTKPSQCPLCDKVMSLRALQKHLGNHQEQLALFALPPNIDATEDEEEDSNYAENHGEPNESLSSDISEGETLDDNGGHNQGLRRFHEFESSESESDDDFSSVPISTPNDEELLDPREGSSSVPDDAVPDSGATISFDDLPTFPHITSAYPDAQYDPIRPDDSIPLTSHPEIVDGDDENPDSGTEKVAEAKKGDEDKLATETKAAAGAAAQFLESAKRAQEKAEEKAAVELEKAKKAAEEEAARMRPTGDDKKSTIKFKDAVGRKFAFPWHLCKTWKVCEFNHHYQLQQSSNFNREWKN
jgi:hypothetical protein